VPPSLPHPAIGSWLHVPPSPLQRSVVQASPSSQSVSV
jgi:hypothetical protein